MVITMCCVIKFEQQNKSEIENINYSTCVLSADLHRTILYCKMSSTICNC